MRKELWIFIGLFCIEPLTTALILMTVSTLGSTIAGGAASSAAAKQAAANRRFQMAEGEKDRQLQLMNMQQQQEQFEEQAPQRAANLFATMKPVLDEKKQDRFREQVWKGF